MSYDEVAKRATMKYIKKKQKRLFVNFRKEEYEKEIEPYINQSGLPVSSYIKAAIKEKIKRDHPEP